MNIQTQDEETGEWRERCNEELKTCIFQLPFMWLFNYGYQTARHVAGMGGRKFQHYYGRKISRGRDRSVDVAVDGDGTKAILRGLGLKCVDVTKLATHRSQFRQLNMVTRVRASYKRRYLISSGVTFNIYGISNSKDLL